MFSDVRLPSVVNALKLWFEFYSVFRIILDLFYHFATGQIFSNNRKCAPLHKNEHLVGSSRIVCIELWNDIQLIFRLKVLVLRYFLLLEQCLYYQLLVPDMWHFASSSFIGLEFRSIKGNRRGIFTSSLSLSSSSALIQATTMNYILLLPSPMLPIYTLFCEFLF